MTDIATALPELDVGAQFEDCGERGEVIDKFHEDGGLVYTVEFNQERREMPHREVSIGVIDGTIRTVAP